jgi:hypothetical protein
MRMKNLAVDDDGPSADPPATESTPSHSWNRKGIPLAGAELELAREAVRNAREGQVTLPQLFMETWKDVRRPRAFGKSFRASVIAGDLPGVRCVGKRTDRLLVYEIRPPPDDEPSASMVARSAR